MYPCTELHVKSANEEKFVHDQFRHQICSSDKYVGGFLSVYAKIEIYSCNFCYLAGIAFFHLSSEFSNRIRSQFMQKSSQLVSINNFCRSTNWHDLEALILIPFSWVLFKSRFRCQYVVLWHRSWDLNERG